VNVLPLPTDVVEALTTLGAGHEPLGGPLRFLAIVSSTNDVAAALAGAGACHGTTVFADAQDAGRGRLGRAWFSPAGAGLYVSCVFRPGDVAGVAPAPGMDARLTLATGVALAEAVRLVSGLPVEIKWPNDLVIGSRKLGGVLCEGSVVGSRLEHVIVGFGMNLRTTSYPPEIARRATSLETELGRSVDRGLVLAQSLVSLRQWWALVRGERFDDILSRWRELAPSSRGAAVRLKGPSDPIVGTTAGIDAEGALLVRAGAELHRVVAGEVNWL
jgi:BirA family biotin operon repressor/biotin-[acetyl-CoA-carboxylase] ligase